MELAVSPAKKVLLMVLAVLILAGLIGWYFWRVPRPQSFQIAGPIERAEGNSIFVNAVFMAQGDPSKILNPEARQEVEVVVTPQTKIVKTALHMPTREELQKSNGYYDPSKLQQEKGPGSLQDLTSGSVDGIFARSDQNIYGQSKFEAAEIDYILAVYPTE